MRAGLRAGKKTIFSFVVNSAARRFLTAAGVEGKSLSSFLYLLTRSYLVVQVYELITYVRRANENAGNLISVVQFLINIYIYIYIYFFFFFHKGF